MGNYSKLIGAVVGNLLGILFVWLSYKGIAECQIVGEVQECEIFGFGQAQVTAAVLAILNTALVYAFPANRPT